jgi:hypothetical protein
MPKMNRRSFLSILCSASLLAPIVWAARKAKNLFKGHIFVDSNKGRLTNDGFTADTPVSSMQAAFDRIPKVVDRDIIINLRGSVDWESPKADLDLKGYSLIMDGGKDPIFD